MKGIPLLFYLLNTILANPTQSYGSSCSLEDGEVGFCTDIVHCPEIRKLLIDELITLDRIIICNKSLRLLCCPLSKFQEEATGASTTTAIETTKQERKTINVLTTTQGQVDLVKIDEKAPSRKKYLCGSSGRPISLVINGTQSERGAWPWLVTLHRFHSNDMFCGGTLISSDVIVTAAHCIQDKEQKYPLKPKEFVIKLGRYNLSLPYEKDGIDAYALKIFIHPNWKFSNRVYDSDIAIIKLNASVTFSTIVSPICLWNSKNTLRVKTGKIVGYGKSERDTKYENIPRELEVKIITNEQCFLKGPRFAYISSPNTFCAGKDEYSAACQGDSGNGMFVEVNGRWYLKGIVSASFLDINNTCDTSADTLFTNVLKFSKWIKETAPNVVEQFEEEPKNQIPYGKEIICSFSSWAVYRNKGGKFTPDSFDPNLCSTAIYHFAGLDDNYKIKSIDPWLDLPANDGFNGYRKFTGLKKSHPHLKLLLSVGGWDEGVQKFSYLASNETLRIEFAANSAEFLKELGFDGLNFYWDFPGDTRRGGTSADKENFPKLLKDIYKVYRERNLYLSVTLRTSNWIVRSAYDLEQIAKYVDAINMMTFDYSSSWEKIIGYPAALSTSLQDNDIEAAVNSFLDQKVPQNKLIMGIILQAQTFKTHTDGYIGDECEEGGFSGPIMENSVYVGYNEICRMKSQKQWTYDFDKVASQMIGRFKENGTTHVAIYDTPRSVANKVKYAMEKGLLGVWAWSIDTDDFRGECSIDNSTYADFGGSSPKLSTEKEFPLLRTMNDVMKFMDSDSN